MDGVDWIWREETLRFLPQRAVWREAGRQLMVADLGFGLAE